jgi:hypothetical protein
MLKDISFADKEVQIKEWNKYCVYIKSDWKYGD